MARRLSRRQFVRAAAAAGAGVALAACAPTPPTGPTAAPPTPAPPTATTAPLVAPTLPPPTEPPAPATPAVAAPNAPAVATAAAVPTAPAVPTARPTHLAVVRGADPAAITTQAIAALGGMERFVRRGDDVIVKPNICNANNTFEYASTTNPEVVATLVRLCLAAGARRVRVMDAPFSGSAEAGLARSGIGEAATAAGAELDIMPAMGYVESDIPGGVDLASWKFYGPVLDADVLINVPIAKHHSATRLTLGAKNLLGVVAQRNALHRNLGQRIADVATRVRPTLTVVDAVRILMRNGPSGGSLDDVRLANTIIASADLVAADTYACSLFEVAPEDVPYIPRCAAAGLGTMDLAGLAIEELSP